MAVSELRGPCPMVGFSLRPPFVDGLHLFGCDIQIANDAKMGVQPFQFVLYSWLLGIDDHWREKPYGRAQPRKCDAHLMQGDRVTSGCRRMICGQILEMASRHDPERGVARHHWIQPRNGVAAWPLRRFDADRGFAL